MAVIFEEVKTFFFGSLFSVEADGHERQREHEDWPQDAFAQESSVLHARNGSVLAGESVYDSTFARRGDSSVFEASSVCESAWGQRDGRVAHSVADAPVAVAGGTAYYSRPPATSAGPFQAQKDDAVDMEVAKYFAENPQVFTMNRGFTRISPGHYLLNGRDFRIERQTRKDSIGAKSQLVVRDGPLTQPLADYLNNKDASAEYSGSVFQSKNALQKIPQNRRMTFNDTGSCYSRIEAMKVAKEQASVRETAAKMMNKGQGTGDLAARYEKTMGMKLGKSARRTDKQLPSFASLSPASGTPISARAGYSSSGGSNISFGTDMRSPRSVQAPMSARMPRFAGGA
jgi:hypothetical protein